MYVYIRHKYLRLFHFQITLELSHDKHLIKSLSSSSFELVVDEIYLITDRFKVASEVSAQLYAEWRLAKK